MTCIWLLKTELYDTLVCKGVVKWSVLISSCYKTNLANHLLETGGTAMVRPAVFLSINSLSKQKFEAMSCVVQGSSINYQPILREGRLVLKSVLEKHFVIVWYNKLPA